MVFLVAGFDTTANALAYTSWLLATHPEKQKKLQDEVDAHCLSSEVGYTARGLQFLFRASHLRPLES